MKKLIGLCCLAFVVAAFAGQPEEADARPAYLKAFMAKYPKVKDAASAKKCGICHPEKSKKVRNDYGKALGKATGKNQKDAEKIDAALDTVAKEKNKDGKTYGEVIDSGELPN